MDKRHAIICDLDGTLALLNGRHPIQEMAACGRDLLNEPVTVVVRAMAEWQNPRLSILLVTGRFRQFWPQTEAWLRSYFIPYDECFMREDGDYRQDAVVKREVYEREIADKYTVLFVLEDRNQCVQMWRELGLTCLQVADGNF